MFFRDRFIDGEEVTAIGGYWGVEGSSKKKGLIDMDSSVVVTGEKGCKGTQW